MVITDPNDPRALEGIAARKAQGRWAKLPSGIPTEVANTVDQYGPKCDVYDAGCVCCVAWRLLEKTLRCLTQEQVEAAM